MCLASVSINKELESDIECPGDVLTYNCSIRSNSENLHLIWRVTLPGDILIHTMYNMTSALQDRNTLSTFISTSLESYTDDKYIESLLFYTIQASDPSLQTATLECFITGLGNASVDIISSAAGLLHVEHGIVDLHIFNFSTPHTCWFQLHSRVSCNEYHRSLLQLGPPPTRLRSREHCRKLHHLHLI